MSTLSQETPQLNAKQLKDSRYTVQEQTVYLRKV